MKATIQKSFEGTHAFLIGNQQVFGFSWPCNITIFIQV